MLDFTQTSTSLMKRVVKDLELHTSYTEVKYLKKVDLYTQSPIYVRLDSASLYDLKYTLQPNQPEQL